MDNCVFCKIINGEIPNYKVYENNNIIVFMDVNPDSNGHMLIVPKQHITDFTLIDNKLIGEINEIAKQMQELIRKKLNPDGIRLVVNYGFLQVVKHYHLHLIPIWKNSNKKLSVEEVYNILMS